MIKNIIISGQGGQGIKLISQILSNILIDLNYEVSLTLNYDTTVFGGEITSFLIYSNEKIENPIIEEPDILLLLSTISEKYIAKKVICEIEVITNQKENEEKIPFQKISEEKFNDKKVAAMIALGKLLNVLKINLNNLDLKKYLPSNNLQNNFNAITYGYKI